MGYKTPKVSVAQDLSWDAFPPMTPDAEQWKPDPDSIAKPGNLPDPRFNRDPFEEQRASAFKKQMKTYYIPADAVEGIKTGLLPRSASGSLGTWPAPAVRATGYPRSLVDDSGSPQSKSPNPASTEIAGFYQTSVTSATSTARFMAPPKSTTESLPVAAPIQRQKTHATAASSIRSGSPLKGDVPAWAAPLEKALAEDLKKTSAKLSSQSSPSIPPHLRKSVKTSNGVFSVSHASTTAVRLNPEAEAYKAPSHDQMREHVPTAAEKQLTKDEAESRDEVLAWKLATADLGLEDDQEGLKLQEEMLYEYSSKPSTLFTLSPPDRHNPPSLPSSITGGSMPISAYSHYMKVKLVTGMEDDLDLEKRATKRELMLMDIRAIDRYMLKVAGAHEHWWQAEQRLR